MTIDTYLKALNPLYQSGRSTEHTFRGDLQKLLESLLPNIRVLNEPTRVDVGAPDYILMHPKHDIPIGYIEAKDIGKDLKSKIFREQFNRYKAGLNNLIITDYLTFEFYFEGEKYATVTIGDLIGKEIKPKEENFDNFIRLMQSFINKTTQSIKSPETLAKMMANKAKLLANVICNAVEQDIAMGRKTELCGMLDSFREYLIHDLTASSFADIYAQTIAYGMFAARYNDKTPDTFSRQEAARLIPHSNPFLRRLFGSIAGIDLDKRITWIVDDLITIFSHTDVKKLMATYGRSTVVNDPIIHFYETFLAEYNPKLRKARGVWYTPKPVVNFIIRAIDYLLKSKFDVKEGLADIETITKKQKMEGTATRRGKNVYEDKIYHRVQLLDPATGTGTFLNEVVSYIYQSFKGMEGIWSQYVDNHLIPRLNGFELLMASYAMAHLKMDMLLKETGYRPTSENDLRADYDKRFRIFLTNSLEEHHKDTGTLFTQWLSEESNEANRIKRDTPVMVVLGNPPYSGESANKGEWIMNLMEDYKKEPGGLDRLKERNPKWINDDYVKFMRYGQHYIEKNGEGILAYINPHGFLDNPTFRGMRWDLLRAYDEIYVLDLHGNSRLKEVSPDGTPDENVFDIMQGVSINIFVKTNKKKKDELAQVYHYDIYGKRSKKYDFLMKNSIEDIDFTKLINVSPQYTFRPKNHELQEEYSLGIPINKLFPHNSVGIITANDNVLVNADESLLIENVQKYYKVEANKNHILKYKYRPFDIRNIYFDLEKVERGRIKVMSHFIGKDNIGLVYKLGNSEGKSVSIDVTKTMIDFRSWSRSGMQGGDYISPLYLYPQDGIGERIPNLDENIVEKISKTLKLPFVTEEANKTGGLKEFSPIDLLDYTYAVLHSPSYRKTYQEYLKTDFPLVPYPRDQTIFWELVTLGRELRVLHLMESPCLEDELSILRYPHSGNNIIENRLTKTENSIKEMKNNPDYLEVWINQNQCFSGIPKSAWEFFIGGYQPADKWLKDRRGEMLSHDDIRHYFNIIKVLIKTEVLINQIDRIKII